MPNNIRYRDQVQNPIVIELSYSKISFGYNIIVFIFDFT
jgi:hypothetical protein